MNVILTLVDKIRWQCRMLPDEPALALPNLHSDIVTYGRLDHYLNNACANLSAMGIVPGAVYGLLVRDPLLHLVLSLALEQMGAATMALYDLQVPKTWTFTAILRDREVGDAAWPTVPVDMSWIEGDGSPVAIADIRGRSQDDVCRICLTSGSTGFPKGVVFTHRAWEQRMARYDHVCVDFSFLKRTMVCVVGAQYRYAVHSLSRGGTFFFPNSSVASTARKIASHNVQYLAAAAATLGNILAAAPDRKSFASLELVRMSGSHPPRKLVEKVRESMCRRILNTYGSMETGMIAAGWADMLDLDGGESGFLVPGTEVDIVDPETRLPVTSGPGALRIRSVSMASGYFGGDPANAFSGGAFYTNDFGSISADGRITLQGRASNVVNLGGDKATIERIELHYAKAPGIRELAAVPVRDALGLTKIIAVIVPNDQWSEQKAWEHFKANLPQAFWPLKFVVTRDLPLGSNGKVDRERLETLIAG